jgi:lysophospholipase L1-like esterase
VVSIRICFVGDSMVNGAGDPECLGWTGRICAEAMRAGHDVTHYNLGIRRETSADIARRWREEVRGRLPSGIDGRVVFSFGLNDLVIEGGRQRVSMPESLANLHAILDEAKERYPLLMVGPPPMLDDDSLPLPVIELSARYATVCQNLGVPYLDVAADLERTGTFVREAQSNDGAHPRAAGYAEFAALVQQWDAWQAWFR